MIQGIKIKESGIMKKKKNLLFVILLAVSILVLLIIIAGSAVSLGYRQFDGPIVKSRAIQMLKMSGVDSCSVSNVRVIPWKQFEIDSLYLKIRIDKDRFAETVVTHCRLEYHMSSMWKFLIVYKGVIFRLFTNKKDGRIVSKKKLFRDIFNLVNAFECSGNVFRITENGKDAAVVNNYHYESGGGADFISGVKGKISADSIVFDRWTLSGMTGVLRSEKGRIILTDCKGGFLDGTFTSNASFTMSPLMLDSAHIEADSISIDKYYLLIKKYQNKISGTADIKMDLGKSVLNQDSINGSGRLTARNVTVKDLPVQNAIVSLIGFPQLANIRFDSIVTDFSLQQGYMIKNKMSGTGEIIVFSASGWLCDDGRLDQMVDGKLTRKFVETLPEIVSESLNSTPDNGRKFKCRVYGSMDHPKVSLSKETLAKAFSGAFDSVRKSIEKALK